MSQVLVDTMRPYADESSWALWGVDPDPAIAFHRASDISFPDESGRRSRPL